MSPMGLRGKSAFEMRRVNSPYPEWDKEPRNVERAYGLCGITTADVALVTGCTILWLSWVTQISRVSRA